MIDDFAIVLTHVLLAIACWRLLARGDLNVDALPETPDLAIPDLAVPEENAAPLPAPALRPAVPSLRLSGGQSSDLSGDAKSRKGGRLA